MFKKDMTCDSCDFSRVLSSSHTHTHNFVEHCVRKPVGPWQAADPTGYVLLRITGFSNLKRGL